VVEEAARAVEEADAELGTGGEVECCQSKEMSGGAGGGVEPGWDGTQMRLPPSIALGDVNDPSIRCTRPLDGLSNSLVRLVGRRGCMGKSKNRRRRGDVNSRIQPESSALMSSPPHFSCIRRHWQRARLHVVVVLGPVVGPVLEQRRRRWSWVFWTWAGGCARKPSQAKQASQPAKPSPPTHPNA
jgi:hypothetical protein